MSTVILRLSHMASNTIAKVFWTQSSIKELLKSTFKHDNVDSFEDEKKCIAIKKKFYTEAYRQLENMCSSIPSELECQVRIAMRLFGDNLFISLKNLSRMIAAIRDSAVDSIDNFIDNICFTNSGTVDVSAIFRKIYCAKPEQVDCYMWILACELCLEEYILQWEPQPRERKNCTKIVRFILKDIHLESYDPLKEPRRGLFRYSYYAHFLMYWKLWKFQDPTMDWSLFISHIRTPSPLYTLFDFWKIYNDGHSIEENMFRLSVVIGNFCAVKYFWNKLSSEAKRTGMEKMVAIACIYEWKMQSSPRCYTSERDKFLPSRTQFFDIASFLIQKMPQSQADKLFSFSRELHSCYKSIWKESLPLVFLMNHAKNPEFCRNMAEKALEYVGYKSCTLIYLRLVKTLLRILHQEAELHGEVIFDIFYEFWRLSPVDSKSNTRSYIQYLWLELEQWGFFSVLDRIINSPRMPNFVEVENIDLKVMKKQSRYYSRKRRLPY